MFNRILFLCLILQFVAVDAMDKQSQRLLESVSAYISIRNKRQQQAYLKRTYNVNAGTEGEALRTIIAKESKILGDSLKVDCEVERGGSYQLFVLSVLHKITKEVIAKIEVKKFNIGSYNSRVHIDPNHDGCFIDAQDGSLQAGRMKEARFVMETNGREKMLREVSSSHVVNKNFYKVREIPCLYQKIHGLCGYYALFNLMRLKQNEKKVSSTDYDFILNRQKFKAHFADWQEHVNRLRRGRNGVGLTNREVESLIRSKAKVLCKKNVMISMCSVGECNPRKVRTFDHRTIRKKIKDFRKGIPQYLILSTSTDKKIKGIKIKWDDRRGRLSCLPNHWIAMKIEWEGRPQKSPVIISVVDSGGPRDNRFTALVHWYYYMFAQS